MAAKRITLLMLEIIAAQNLSIGASTDAELNVIVDRNIAAIERAGACEIITAMPDAVLRWMVERALAAKES
jgi:hypothetical protein